MYPGGARTTGTGAARAGGVGGAGAGGPGDGGTGAGDPGAGGTGVGGAGSGGTGFEDSLTECHEPESCTALPARAVRIGRRVPRPRPPPDPGTHIMALRPSFVPLRVPLPSPPPSSLADDPDPEFDLARAAIYRAWGSCLEDGVQLSSLDTQTLRSSRHRCWMCSSDRFSFRRHRRLRRHLTRSFAKFLQDSPLPAPSPYSEQTDSLTKCHEPESCTALPARAVRIGRRVPRPRPPPDPGTHIMALRPSFVPLRVPLPSPPPSSLADDPDPEFDLARAASPTVPRLLATDPSFESTVASALVAELVDFATACRLDYATSLEDFECLAVAVPHLVAMLLAPEGDLDAPDIPTPRSYAEAITGSYSSQRQTAMDVEMASWKSTGTYIDEVPPHEVNIVDGMWIFRVKRPPGSPPVLMVLIVRLRSTQGAMATQELRWLTYLLTDLGERLRSSPQRGQLCLAYVATRANTADIFTKVLQPGDHQRFCIVLGVVPILPHLLTA
ncbi:unnamed protein product [Closterium sp. NIES-53]